MSANINKQLKKIIPEKVLPYTFAEKWLLSRSRGKVISGPFKRLKYAVSSIGSAYFPKIVGTYEKELHQIVESLLLRDFKTVLNIGAGEGYYAVGFAANSPHSKVYAFETEENGQKLISAMAKLNQVEDRVFVAGHCEIDELLAVIDVDAAPLVIMDIEGGEKQLLDPEKIPGLVNSHILVELHDFAYRDISEILTNRFEKTHEIIEIWANDRTLNDFPIPIPFIFRKIFPQHFLYFMDEGRGERMRWYYMKPFSENNLSD